jgi:hypothetical protein
MTPTSAESPTLPVDGTGPHDVAIHRHVLSPAPSMRIGATRWTGLLRAGGVAALLIGALLIAEIVVYAVLPRSETAAEHFALFDRDWLAGLLTLDLLGMVAYVLFIPTTLALYVALHRRSEGLMLAATALLFVGIAVFFATNTAFPVLALAQQYASAATDAERATLLAAGEALFALFNETAFLTSYVMVSAAWTMIGIGMLRSGSFGRATAYTGMLAGGAGVLAVVMEHAAGALVAIAIPVYFAAMMFLLAWMVLTGPRLLHLSDMQWKP